MAEERALAVKILDGDKVYKIFVNGDIEGFNPHCKVFNYVPAILASAVAMASKQYRRQQHDN